MDKIELLPRGFFDLSIVAANLERSQTFEIIKEKPPLTRDPPPAAALRRPASQKNCLSFLEEFFGGARKRKL